jgi:hypothetical protein
LSQTRQLNLPLTVPMILQGFDFFWERRAKFVFQDGKANFSALNLINVITVYTVIKI